jgi:heme a synthase
VGVFAQAVLGQLTVEFDLHPQFVMAHFLLSIVLLSDAIWLYWRAGQPDDATETRAIGSSRIVAMSRVLLVAAAAILVTGTVVTGAGPHSGGGQHDNVARLGIKVESAARVHGTLVMVFLALVLATLWLIRKDRAPASVQTRLTVLLVVLVAQAGVGYAQYFSDIPPLLVGIHIAGAAAVWSATLVFALGCFRRTAPALTGAPPDEPSASMLART